MAFWGVEVGPSKPYVHKFDPSRGRLRISQATLGGGDNSATINVQCSVGGRSPVLLCSLIPKVCETCRLELEFEEDEEVIFSVRSLRSVYLTGYYLGHRPSFDGEDSESYGEDIAESDATDTYSDGSEDEYESDFIDDADVAIYTDSHGPKSSVVIEEILEDDDKHHNHHRLKKKHQISDSDDDETVSTQLAVRNKESMKGESEDEDGFPICFNVGDKTSRKKKIRDDQKRKVDETSQNIVSISEANIAPDSTLASETVSKNNENSKKRKEKDEKSSLRSKTEDKQESETNANLSINGIEEHAEESLNVVKDTQNDGNPDICKQSKKKSKKRKVREEGLSVEKDSSTAPKKEEEMPVDNTAITDVNAVTKEQKKEKKKKKKDKKKNGDSAVIKEDASVKEKAEVVNGGRDESQHGSQAKKTRTFPNGLIVEEISMGKPDGKKAAPGKKVSVHYIGKLKNGTIFDSNIGQRPFKFRLGIGEVIKGWDIGVNGMCVGDKRRLTVPPSFGYGAKGVGKIPPNSWLVFDVELVDVY